MNTYEFSLVLGAVNADTQDLEDSLFEAVERCSDLVVRTRKS